ncbi:MAG: ribonuclease P protein component [Clostridia bacterium]|nr:ribonuclease P protein component [Clostridia bacterium]
MKIISLTRNGQFQRLYRKGRSFVAPTMVVYVSENRLPVTRLGITTGKKVGGAVERNRAKRRIRELFRISLPNLKAGMDVCVVARSYTVTAPAEKMRKDFGTAMEKLGMWNHEKPVDSSDSRVSEADFPA